jgi:anti-anti-sigma factor
MPVEKWSDSVVVVRLADNPHLSDDLDALDQMTQGGRRINAVVDFSGVKFVNSSNLAKLLKLRRQMSATDSRLVLCGTNTQVWGAFLVTNLDKMFQFSDNVATALATVQIKPADSAGS